MIALNQSSKNRVCNHLFRMNTINTLKKLFLKSLKPLRQSTFKMKYSDQDQRFRNLFKKRKSTLVFGALICFLLAFGIGNSFTFFTALIASSPIVVIFWSSFGDQLMRLFKFKNINKE